MSKHQPHDCLHNRLFKAQIKEMSKLRRSVNSPHKGPVTQKMFPFDDVIMLGKCVCVVCVCSENKIDKARFRYTICLIRNARGFLMFRLDVAI